MEPKVEHPERLEFKGDAFLDQVRARRPELLAAALTVLRYRIRGEGIPHVPAMASFEAWSHLIRTAVVAVGLPDPVATQQGLAEDDAAASTAASLFAAIHTAKGDDWWTVRQLVAEAFPDPNARYGGAGEADPLQEAIDEACNAVGTYAQAGSRTNRLGLFMRSREASIAGGLRLDRGDKGRQGRRRRVVSADTPKPGRDR
jgi:putative DNA primase/helicase